MPSKQQDFYNQLRQETETKAQTYREFREETGRVKKAADERIAKLKSDMKFIAKQIEANNQMLQIQGLEAVKFER